MPDAGFQSVAAWDTAAGGFIDTAAAGMDDPGAARVDLNVCGQMGTGGFTSQTDVCMPALGDGPLLALAVWTMISCEGARCTTLDLRHTRVSDVSPLASLTAMTSLNLAHTRLIDLSTLASLTALTSLNLSGTQVSDVSPLARLTALTSLVLADTQVSDVSALAALCQRGLRITGIRES